LPAATVLLALLTVEAVEDFIVEETAGFSVVDLVIVFPVDANGFASLFTVASFVTADFNLS
jgi:hypothetical protein